MLRLLGDPANPVGGCLVVAGFARVATFDLQQALLQGGHVARKEHRRVAELTFSKSAEGGEEK